MLPLRGMARGLSVQRLGPKAFLADPGAYKDDQNQAQGWHGMARQTDFNHLDADSGQTKILAQRFVPCPPPILWGWRCVGDATPDKTTAARRKFLRNVSYLPPSSPLDS